MVNKNLVAVGILVVLFIAFGFFVHYARPIYNNDCLEMIAGDYCIENNMTFYRHYNGENQFYCSLDYNPRVDSYKPSEKFYFLDSEMDSCLIKSRWSFAKTARNEHE